MAPEIMEEKLYDNKSDMYSLGVVFYNMLYGTYQYPFNGKSIYQLT